MTLRLYDPDLAPREHFQEVLRRACTPPPSQASLLATGEYSCGRWLTYPHSPWPGVSPVGNAPACSSTVHTPETNPHACGKPLPWEVAEDTTDPAILFRHSGWKRHRRLVRAALVDLETPPRPLERFDTCGSDPWIVVDESDSTRLAIHSNHCHSRWCTPCSRERAARIVGNLRVKLNDGEIRLLTLTIKHNTRPLPEQIDRIYDAFRKLRRAPFWIESVDGGCAVLELKHSHTTGLWHVHLHCLLDGTWIDAKDLKAEWWRITGDSFVVDIRECNTAERASHYVTKYVTKPVPNCVINKPEQLREMMSAIARRRLVLTWGSWRGVRLSEPLDATVWKSIASLADVYKRKQAGNLDAYTLLAHLEKILPEVWILAGRDPPNPADDPIGLLF